MTENYYTSQKGKLLKAFDRVRSWVEPNVTKHYGQAFASTVLQEARNEYESLLPHIPFIGGSKNRWTSELIESAQILALFRAMKAQGKTVEESAAIVYRGMESRLAQYPRFLLQLMGWLQFRKLFVRSLQRRATESQKRTYPGDFVANVVIGDGEDFDWGIDFTECAICKFYQAHHASEFLPLVCRIDYLTSEAFGLGLVRTKTLAEGADRCDARLKRDRPTQWR